MFNTFIHFTQQPKEGSFSSAGPFGSVQLHLRWVPHPHPMRCAGVSAETPLELHAKSLHESWRASASVSPFQEASFPTLGTYNRNMWWVNRLVGEERRWNASSVWIR